MIWKKREINKREFRVESRSKNSRRKPENGTKMEASWTKSADECLQYFDVQAEVNFYRKNCLNRFL